MQSQQSKQQQHQQHFYVLQQWYNQLKQHTSPTIFIPLTQQQIKMIILIYQTIYAKYFRQLNYMSKKNNSQQSFVNSKQNWIYDTAVKKMLQQNNIKQTCKSLIDKIQNNITKNNKYFVKLSLRSPKDSLALRKYKNRLQLKYSSIEPYKQYPNLYAQLQRLQLISTNAEDMLQILCTSQRICDDLRRLLKKGDDGYDVNIIIRQWKTIPSCLQFRVFMKDRKVTAISSYYKSERHEWLVKYKNIITESIVKFFEEYVVDVILYNDGIFDIGLQLTDKQMYLYEQIEQLLTNKNYKVTIIEVNPFGKETGAALFSWQIDKQILNSGPLTVRFSGQQNY